MISGLTEISDDVIYKEGNKEDYITILRSPRFGWKIKVVWHCPVDTWHSPFFGDTGECYAMKSYQIKDIYNSKPKGFFKRLFGIS